MPKFPENKNYKQPPLPMVEGTSIHKEALEKASPTTFGTQSSSIGKSALGGTLNITDGPKPHTHAEGTEGVRYKEKGSGGGMGGWMSRTVSNSGEEGLEEDHVYESSRGTENA